MRQDDFTADAQGRLEQTPNGHLTFIPNNLPPHLDTPLPLVRKIVDAERALGELAGVGRDLPNPHLLMMPFIRREAVLSSRIEGTVTRLDQLLLFEVEPDAPTDNPSDVKEVQNYVEALELGLKRLAEGMPLCLRLIRELHERLMQGVRGDEQRPGEFRDCQVIIGRQGQSIADARFVPPPPQSLNPLLQDFEQFLNNPGDLPVVVQLALAHYQFEAIHPFRDGNGRVGRLLITLILCERKSLPQPLLYLSAYFEKRDAEYRDHLLNISQRGTWQEWIAFFADGVAEQAHDAVLRVRGLRKLQDEYRDRMQRASQSTAILRLVDHLFSIPYLTIRFAEKLLDQTHRAASQNVKKLIAEGILEPLDPNRKKNRVFVARRILDLLSADSATEAPES